MTRADSLFRSLTDNLQDIDPASFHILIADDNDEVRLGLRLALQRERFVVSEARDGNEIFSILEQKPADLIILDVMMPERDGLTVVRQLRSQHTLASPYIILVTGRSSLEEKVEGLNVGADDYLTKPFELKELIARVRAGIRIKALHRTLRETQETIVRQEKRATIGLLAAGIAHEFNNLMSAISGYAQLARTHEKYKERLVEVALDQVQRAQKITQSLSSFAGNSMAGAQKVPIRPLVEASLCLLEKEMRSRRIDVAMNVPDDLPLVFVDKVQMQQVFVHLLLNAAQAAGGGGRIEVRASAQDGWVAIEVDDNGPGVPVEIRGSIFDPFFTTKGALGNSEEPGTGLGLSFSLNIVQQFEGRLDLAPSRLGGACFRIMIPALQNHTPAKASGPTTTAVDNPPRIVLVEDDPALQEIISEVVPAGTLTIFAEGPPAVEHCLANRVDVLLLDLQISGPWNGERVLDELRRFEHPPAVIVTTGSTEFTESELTPPVVGVMPKPYALADIEQAVERALTHSARPLRTH
ncbi:MAG: response regulator [Planctomycetota bacterium]